MSVPSPTTDQDRSDPAPWTLRDLTAAVRPPERPAWEGARDAWRASAAPAVIVGIDAGVVVRVVLIACAVWIVLGAIGAAILLVLGVI